MREFMRRPLLATDLGLNLSLVLSGVSCFIIQSYWLSKIQLITSNSALSFALSTTSFFDGHYNRFFL